MQTQAVSTSGNPSEHALHFPQNVSRRIRDIIIALSFGLCGVTAALAQADGTWGVVDDVTNGSSSGIASDANGNVFVCGSYTDSSGAYHALVLKSSDHGQTWDSNPSLEGEQASDDYRSTDGSVTWYSAITTYRESNVIATGRGNGKRWIVRRSNDSGATWVNLTDALDCKDFYLFQPSGITVDSGGRIYIAGSAESEIVTRKSTTRVYHWIVVRSTDDGKSWEIIRKLDSSSVCGANGIACVGPDVFVVGQLNSCWEVQRYSGESWLTVDRFQAEAGYSARAVGIVVDPSTGAGQPSNLIVVGSGTRQGSRKNVSVTNWIVRRGTGSPDSPFQTIDVFSNSDSYAAGVAIDRSGNVYVTGTARGDNNLAHWFTRRSTTRGSAPSQWTWEKTDEFYESTVRASQGWDVTADINGNVFVSGTSNSDADQTDHRWIIRRNPKVLPPFTP